MEDFEKTEKDLATGGWVRTAKDLFAGAVGGVAQVLLGKWKLFTAGDDATGVAWIGWSFLQSIGFNRNPITAPFQT